MWSGDCARNSWNSANVTERVVNVDRDYVQDAYHGDAQGLPKGAGIRGISGMVPEVCEGTQAVDAEKEQLQEQVRVRVYAKDRDFYRRLRRPLKELARRPHPAVIEAEDRELVEVAPEATRDHAFERFKLDERQRRSGSHPYGQIQM